jgi:predicted HicB family RNase H-like nuclease
LPAPERSGKYSGRFLLRVPAPVHQALALKARAARKSLNSYCAERLAAL